MTALGNCEEPTPIQREAIPVLLAGKDIVGQAATGTGKTAAFALPMLDLIRKDGPSRTGGVRGLVLVPTRELAMQVTEAVHNYAKGVGLSVVAVYGGSAMDTQIRSIALAWTSSSPRPGGRSTTCAARRSRSIGCRCWCSTRRTRCSTWASPRTSRRF